MKQHQLHLSSRLTVGLWIVVFFLASGLSALIPPMQSPDEHSHIARAYAISNAHFQLDPLPANLDAWKQQYASVPGIDQIVQRTLQNGKPAGAWVDAGLVAFLQAYEHIGMRGGMLSDDQASQVNSLAWTGQQVYFPAPGTGYYFPLIYAPQALGLRIGQWLDLSIKHSYQLTRTLTLLTSLALLAGAFRLLSPSPVMLGLLMLPMSLFQLLSPTLDGVTSALAIFCFSLFLAALDTRQRHASRMATTLSLGVALLVASRNQLAPLLLLPLFLAWRHKSARHLAGGLTAAAAVVGWTLYAMQASNDQRVVRLVSSSDLLLHYLGNPAEFFQITVNTLANPELVRFYQQSFIGILGWLSTPLPSYWYPLLWIGIGLCAVLSIINFEVRIDYRTRVLLLVTSIASVLLTFLALLTSWTPHPAQVVSGIQGRYFMIPALMLGMTIAGIWPAPSRYRNLINISITGCVAGLSMLALVTTLLARYHLV